MNIASGLLNYIQAHQPDTEDSKALPKAFTNVFRDWIVPIYSWSKFWTPGLVPRLKTGLIYFPSVWLWGPGVLMRNSNKGKVAKTEIQDKSEQNVPSGMQGKSPTVKIYQTKYFFPPTISIWIQK